MYVVNISNSPEIRFKLKSKIFYQKLKSLRVSSSFEIHLPTPEIISHWYWIS